jgi:rhodanese-related sulfurtransferase
MLVNPSDIVARAKATITECSVREAREWLNPGTIFIDIREPAEFHRGFIPGAIHLPRGLLEFDLHAIVDQARCDQNVAQEDQAIILYCGTGGRSALAAKTAEEMGYRNVKSMDGGLVAWVEAKFPLDVSA